MVTITFAVVFLISSIGDVLGEFNRATFAVESHWLVWLSPWGWLGQVYAFHDNIGGFFRYSACCFWRQSSLPSISLQKGMWEWAYFLLKKDLLLRPNCC